MLRVNKKENQPGGKTIYFWTCISFGDFYFLLNYFLNMSLTLNSLPQDFSMWKQDHFMKLSMVTYKITGFKSTLLQARCVYFRWFSLLTLPVMSAKVSWSQKQNFKTVEQGKQESPVYGNLDSSPWLILLISWYNHCINLSNTVALILFTWCPVLFSLFQIQLLFSATT